MMSYEKHPSKVGTMTVLPGNAENVPQQSSITANGADEYINLTKPNVSTDSELKCSPTCEPQASLQEYSPTCEPQASLHGYSLTCSAHSPMVTLSP